MRNMLRMDLRPWIEERFDRAGGPGGQNVNKVSTRVTLLLDFQTCPYFSDVERRRIAERLRSRLAADGRLRVVSQSGRTQLANRNLAELRLRDMLWTALRTPRRRIPTVPTEAARRRRLQAKRRLGALKQTRRKPIGDGD